MVAKPARTLGRGIRRVAYHAWQRAVRAAEPLYRARRPELRGQGWLSRRVTRFSQMRL
jgi:hypothetical protein